VVENFFKLFMSYLLSNFLDIFKFYAQTDNQSRWSYP